MSVSRLWNSEFDASADSDWRVAAGERNLKKVIAAIAEALQIDSMKAPLSSLSSTIDGGPKLGVYPDPGGSIWK